jgi:hypothetical protein
MGSDAKPLTQAEFDQMMCEVFSPQPEVAVAAVWKIRARLAELNAPKEGDQP